MKKLFIFCFLALCLCASLFAEGTQDDLQEHQRKARDYARNSSYRNAITEYTEIINHNTNASYSRRAYFGRAEAYSHRMDWDSAISDYTAIIWEFPNYADDAYFERGNIYLQWKGDLDRAISDYTEAIKLSPEFAGTYYNRGVAYYNKGYIDQAIADWEEVLYLEPNNTDAANRLKNARGY
jgi:tetratricopeptide (TPR) repeat protein